MTGYASQGELGCLFVMKGILPKPKMDDERPVQLASPRTLWDSLMCSTDPMIQIYVRIFHALPFCLPKLTVSGSGVVSWPHWNLFHSDPSGPEDGSLEVDGVLQPYILNGYAAR